MMALCVDGGTSARSFKIYTKTHKEKNKTDQLDNTVNNVTSTIQDQECTLAGEVLETENIKFNCSLNSYN